MTRVASRIVIVIVLMMSWFGCKKEIVPLSPTELITSWVDMALHITKTTPANSPTFASRCFGYFGVTMYESVVSGYQDFQSLSGQLKGLDLNQDHDGQNINPAIALNAGQAEILRLIYIQTSDENKRKIDILESENYERLKSGISDPEHSKEYGYVIAKNVFEWSLNDGGHRGYLKNFDKSQPLKECKGCWAPPLFGQSFSHWPLHPHWGKNRVFVFANDSLVIPYMIPFDTVKGTHYYQQMFDVYEQGNKLNAEEKQTAIWWADDPDSTFTPPGHSVFLMKNALKKQKTDLITSAQIYAALGMGLADAYIKCWDWKYHYFSERPNTYINKYIDARWESFWPDPPFPAFPSGHAIQGSVAATVLEYFFGSDYQFNDEAHEGRYPDEVRGTPFVPRSFNSFSEMAKQCAHSRFLGGIHTPQDNQTGIEQGQIIGSNILMLKWKK